MTLQAEMVYPSHSVGYQKVKLWVFVMIICAVFMLSGTGCALHHYDKATGTEHIWGFGHMKMKFVPDEEGLQTVVRGTDVLGISAGRVEKQAYLTAGWHRIQRLDIVTQSTAFRLEWPNSDFAQIRVGSEFPYEEDGTYIVFDDDVLSKHQTNTEALK